MWISGHFGVQFWVCDVIKGVSINLLHNFNGTIGLLPSRNIIIPISRLKGSCCCILLYFTWISGHLGVKIRVFDVSKGVSINSFYNFIVTIGFLPSRNITIPILRLEGSFCCILFCFMGYMTSKKVSRITNFQILTQPSDSPYEKTCQH